MSLEVEEFIESLRECFSLALRGYGRICVVKEKGIRRGIQGNMISKISNPSKTTRTCSIESAKQPEAAFDVKMSLIKSMQTPSNIQVACERECRLKGSYFCSCLRSGIGGDLAFGKGARYWRSGLPRESVCGSSPWRSNVLDGWFSKKNVFKRSAGGSVCTHPLLMMSSIMSETNDGM